MSSGQRVARDEVRKGKVGLCVRVIKNGTVSALAGTSLCFHLHEEVGNMETGRAAQMFTLCCLHICILCTFRLWYSEY